MKLVCSVPLKVEGGEAQFDERDLDPFAKVYLVAELDAERDVLCPFRTALTPSAVVAAGAAGLAIDPQEFYAEFDRWLDRADARGALRIVEIRAGLLGHGVRSGHVFAFADETVITESGEVDVERTRFRFALLVKARALTGLAAPPGTVQ